jgi:thiol-disulfide isomerase/thioredoxin
MAAMMGVQGAVADEVNKRLQKAQDDLVEKYATGKGGMDSSVDGPTGSAYKEKHMEEQRAKKAIKEMKKQAEENAEYNRQANRETETALEEGDADDDEDLRRIREQRLKDIKNAQREKLDNIAKGHGQYREIVQDEFLAEVTASTRVICHFYHKDFPRCKVIDHHIQKLVQRHVETKFVKIDAEKAPFFVSKLTIRTIPTVVIFIDGVAVDKIIGFEGLADGMPEGKEDEWPTVKLARLLAAKRGIDKSAIVDDDEAEAAARRKMDEMRKSIYSSMHHTLDDEDDDFDLENA